MIIRNLRALWADESGISSVEYALLLAFVCGGIIMAANILSDAVANQMNEVASCFDGEADANGGQGGGTGGDGGNGNGAGNGGGFAVC